MHANYFIGMLADAAAPATPPANGLFGNPIIFLVLMAVMMYFLLIRPQQQRAKQQQKLLAALKAGDKVVTAAGIIATVITVKDKTVTLRSADSKFEVTKASVTEILPDDAATTTVS
ncbi:MAG TPA: preprotein translocase subunit YajC [Verrucomicrobiae bacterium]